MQNPSRLQINAQNFLKNFKFFIFYLFHILLLFFSKLKKLVQISISMFHPLHPIMHQFEFMRPIVSVDYCPNILSVAQGCRGPVSELGMMGLEMRNPNAGRGSIGFRFCFRNELAA